MKPYVEVTIGYKYTLWVMFYCEQTQRGLDPSAIAGLVTFLRAWRRNVAWPGRASCLFRIVSRSWASCPGDK